MPQEVQGRLEAAAGSTSGSREDQGILQRVLLTISPDPKGGPSSPPEVGGWLSCAE